MRIITKEGSVDHRYKNKSEMLQRNIFSTGLISFSRLIDSEEYTGHARDQRLESRSHEFYIFDLFFIVVTLFPAVPRITGYPVYRSITVTNNCKIHALREPFVLYSCSSKNCNHPVKYITAPFVLRRREHR